MLLSFKMARLDLYTLKSQMASYLLIPILTVLFSMMNSSLLLLAITASWLMMIVNTNLFAVQERYGLERLYSSLPGTRKSYVAGRYLASIMNFLIAFIIMLLTALFTFSINGKMFAMHEIFSSFSISLLIFSAIQAIQLPIYFSFGYSKGRFLSMIPFLAFFGIGLLTTYSEKMGAAIAYILSHNISLYCLFGSIAVMIVSYFVSLQCYKKRR